MTDTNTTPNEMDSNNPDQAADHDAAGAVADVNVDLSDNSVPPDPPEQDPNIDADLVQETDGDGKERDDSDPTSEFEEEYGITEQELREKAQEDGRRLMDSVDADTEAERISKAIEQCEEKFDTMREQLRATNQKAQQARQEHQKLQVTVDRLYDIANDDDRLVIRTLPGGVAEEVIPDEREGVAEELDERRGQLEGRAEEFEDRVETLKRECKKMEMVYEELREAKGLLSESAANLLGSGQ